MAISYPYRVFRYQVEIDGIARAGFSEVSGMDSTGLTKFGNITLRWGTSDDSDFLDWIYSVAPKNSAPPTGMVRHDVTVTLLDDTGAPGPSWKLINAWPVRYAVPDLNALGAEVAIQTLELCHEGLEMTPGGPAGAPSTI